MQKTIDNLSGHIIVCGLGTTGTHVVSEFMATKTPFVVIETNECRIREFEADNRHNGGLLYVHGDATEDRTLNRAGIENASGLVAATPSDKDNLYLTLSARQLNPNLRIIARVTEPDARPKMLRAGADQVVSPNYIGGMRIASEMIRPQVVEFLDMMLRDKERNFRIEQVHLHSGSPLLDMRLSDAKIREKADVLIIAVRGEKGNYDYSPGPDTMLKKDTILIVLGAQKEVARLRKTANPP